MPGEEPAPAVDPLAAEDPAMADPALDAAPMEDPMGVEGEDEPEEGITDEEIPLGATDDFADLEGENLGNFSAAGTTEPLTIDLGALQESIEALKQSLDEDEEIEITEEEIIGLLEDEEEALDESDEDGDDDDSHIAKKVTGQAASTGASAGLDAIMSAMSEELGQDALIDAIMEKLTVDIGADLSGWAGRSSSNMRRAIEKEMAHRRSTDGEEELKDLKKAQEELVFENNQLTEKLSEYQAAIGELKEGLQDTNLSNARLLYTNRVLRNTSLNERQKDKIAEAISNAGSVTEAKTIYDTLQSTVVAKPKKSPQSLSEAIGHRNTVLRATHKEEPASDPFQSRMKRLAGIK
jgi:hypothetical protein